MTDTPITERLKDVLKDAEALQEYALALDSRDQVSRRINSLHKSLINNVASISRTISSAESDAGKLALKIFLTPCQEDEEDDYLVEITEYITAALLKAASVKAQDETGWLIELAASPPSEPKYWQNGSLWTGDNIKAIRFARKEDAERIAALMLDGMNIRICEHIWTA